MQNDVTNFTTHRLLMCTWRAKIPKPTIYFEV